MRVKKFFFLLFWRAVGGRKGVGNKVLRRKQEQTRKEVDKAKKHRNRFVDFFTKGSVTQNNEILQFCATSAWKIVYSMIFLGRSRF